MARAFRYIFLSPPISLALLTLTANANTKPPEEELVVTASRQNSSSFELPYSVEVLDKRALNHQQARNLPEALAGIPGVLVQKTANGQGSPFVRGFTGYRTLALIDGVRYNNAVYRDGPNEYFSLIDVNSLSKLELLKGPASGLYGSDAIGGALALHTKASRHRDYESGEHYQQGNLQYRYASAEQSRAARAELELGQGQQWGLRLGYTDKDFGDVVAADLGKQPFTGYDEKGLDLRLDSELSEHWGLSLVHQQLRQDDVWRTHSTIYALSFADSGIGTDLRRLKDQARQLSLVKLRGEDLDAWVDSVTLTISDQRWQEDGDRIKAGGSRIIQGFDSTMQGLDLSLTTEGASVYWHYGLDYYHDQIHSWRRDYQPSGELNAVRIQGPIGDNSRYTQWGLYAQADWQLTDTQSLLWSSRFGRTHARVGRFEDPLTGGAASFSDHWSSLVQALRYSYRLSSAPGETLLWAGISQSFRAPNIGDLSRYGKSRSSETEIAATNLNPELFLTHEIRLKWQHEGSDINMSYYRTRIRDFIASTPTGRIVDSLTEVTKQNASSGYIEGVEVSAKQSLNDSWSVTANLTWLAGELDNSSGEREPYSRIMPPSVNVQLRWQPRQLDGEISLEFQFAGRADKLSAGDQDDLQRIPPGGTPAYRLWHLRSHLQVTPQLQLNLALDNVFDEPYRNHGSGTNEPGRNLKIGFHYDF